LRVPDGALPFPSPDVENNAGAGTSTARV
jgi:hypothetical protein